MNNSTIINNKELDLLNTMIWKTFDKYKCDPFINSPMVYGIVGIYIDGKPFKITSLLRKVQRFLTTDEVAEFKIAETTDDSIKTFMVDGYMIDNPVNSKINSITIINDFQTIKHDGKLYNFNSTVALIFTLEDSRELSFEIGTWFSEMITIQKGYELIKNLTPTDDFIEECEDCAGYIPEIKRELIIIN